MKKKIGILLNTSWYIYNFRKNLIIKLIEENYEVHAIAPYDDYSSKLEELGCIFHHIEMDSKSKNPISDVLLLKRIKKTLKGINLDVLLNFTIKPNIYGTLAASSLGISCVNNVAGMGTLFTEGILARTLFKGLFKISQKKASTVFFQNPDDLEELTKNNIVAKNISELLPGSGVNLEEFPYIPITKTKNITFLLIARMIYPKGIVELIEASKILRNKGYDFQIQLLGELGVNNPNAIEKTDLDKLCSPEFITYLGKTDDVKSVIQESDVVVLPSYYREGTPKSLLESLGTGRPIITTDMPGCKETVVDGVNGFLCEPKSIEDLSDKMEKILCCNFEDLLKMGEESRKLAINKYDERIVISKYVNAIKNCLK